MRSRKRFAQRTGALMELRDLIVFTPAGTPDPSLAIAASRAGAAGFLDLEYVSQGPTALAALARLERFAHGDYGVKVGPVSAAVVEELLRRPPQRLRRVLLAGGEHSQLAAWADGFRQQGIEPLLEATSEEEMRLAERLGIEGLVLKGNEAGGRVGDETAFVLLQRWRRLFTTSGHVRAWVQGGIGLNTAAACAALGARGLVLDSQLLLTRESPLDESARAWLTAFDGSETLCLGFEKGLGIRIAKRPADRTIERLIETHGQLDASDGEAAEKWTRWQEAVQHKVETGDALLLVGQDACLARRLGERFVTVSGVLRGIIESIDAHLDAARRLRPLAEGAELAQRHRTRYPVLQGPMTRVSDTAAFAESVARAGGLPFLALALLRRKEVEPLLAETKTRLGERSWGVGILGFLPPEIRKEQVEAVRAAKPPFALIAGGRPDQARELEREGIATYLHVPSPGLLRMFLREGARRFVFEGRECGGHVGPRGSFVLWETMCELLLEHIESSKRGDDLHIVFAGGIHDAASAAAVAALAAPLAERGAAIGVLMGTAYLFTQEAVESGAIVPRFQKEALSLQRTVLLETGPGHAIRCVETPYFEQFNAEKRRLRREGKSPEEITRTLEMTNIGRLRVASKGLDRVAGETGASRLAPVPEEEQYARGMYMIGQVAALHDGVTTMERLHEEVCAGGTHVLEKPAPRVIAARPQEKPCDIAIIGMSCYYPGSTSLRGYWENILHKVDAVTEVPESHWDWRLYYDPDPQARDKIVSKWGGFMSDVPFEPLRYGITPASMKCIEPLQLLMLEATRHALTDCGYDRRPFDRERTCAVVGIGGGGMPLAVAYGFRACLPLFATVPGLELDVEGMMETVCRVLPEWTEDSFPGFLNNVAVGRVANRFDFGGMNMAIDAACASSLAAIHSCVRELEAGTSDLAVAMGADTVMTPYAFTAFSKTHALSPRGKCSPFDAAGDGIVLSEGVGVVVLKRLADAERDGDPIYAVIRGVGSSSDGKDKGLTAPNLRGQLRALRRAYEKANISPARVGLIEAHGTGTVVGDQTEAESLIRLMEEAGAQRQSVALGSVKSMIGHTKCAAGIAGLIKAALALHHKTLPPTLVERPNPRIGFESSALYLNADARPWIHGGDEPRCAGVSAFGFGGTNFHVVLEEYVGNYLGETPPALRDWPVELFVWRRPSRETLIAAVQQVRDALFGDARPDLASLAASLWKASSGDPTDPVAAIVAESLDDAKEKIDLLLERLQSQAKEGRDPRGIYFAERPAEQGGKVALLFPGQGSQYPNMLAQAGMTFPEVRETLDRAERMLAGRFELPLGRYIYPPSSFTPEEERRNREALARTDVAQPALGAAGLGMYRLLTALGIEADFFAGHSYGEYVALCAAGAIGEDDLLRISHERGRLINEAAGGDAGGMVAVDADGPTVTELVTGLENVWPANFNSPTQTVVAGTEAGLEALLRRLQDRNIRGRRIPVACGFHSPLVSEAARPLAQALSELPFQTPRQSVYSNTLAAAYPSDPEAVAALLADHLGSPVRFHDEILALYEAGARIFVEVGPQGVLTGLVGQILAGHSHIAVATDLKGRQGLIQLQHTLAQLLVSGVGVQLERLYRDREVTIYELAKLEQQTRPAEPSPMTWVVNGVRQRLFHEPEPYVLGQRRKDIPAEPAAPRPPAPKRLSDPTPPSPSTTTSPVSAQPTVTPGASVPRASVPVHQNGAGPAVAANGHGAVYESHRNGHGALPPLPDDSAAAVMHGFQDLMGRFLETQRSVMLAYLGAPQVPAGSPLEGPPLEGPLPAVAPPIAAAPPRPIAAAPSAEPVSIAQEERLHAEPAAAVESNGQAPAASSPPPTQTSPTTRREEIAEQLLELVSKRTGYPKEMLGLDLDLEGELGIDSIKRVEILGSLAESLGDGEGGLDEESLQLEQLTTLRTLRSILDYLEGALGNSPAAAEPASASSAAANPGTGRNSQPSSNGALHADDAGIQRGLVRLVEAALPTEGAPLMPSGTVVITDDGRGIATEVASRLASYDVGVVLVRQADASTAEGYAADLTDSHSVELLVERLRSEVGPLAGLIHLAPLAAAETGETWSERARRDVRSLYLLAKHLERDLRAAGAEGGALLLAPTAMGGGLGFDDALPEEFLPGYGGIAGFTKCLGSEWPEVLVRVVDLDRSHPVEELAQQILEELNDPNGALEVGWLGGRRVTWEPFDAPLSLRDDAPAPLDKDSVVLITGGARGITARIAEELARRHGATFVIVGRSPLPEAEPAETASLVEQAEIKAALISRFQREGRPPAPAAIEEAYQRLIRNREIRENLERIGAAGGTVEYHQADVRNESELARLIDDVQRRLGGIDGVIHAAGVIDDKLVRDKTPESFDRVFGTKVDGAAILVRHLDPQRLRFCAFFASIASRYGNRGQSDYAAANEVLSKLAFDLDRRWPCRVFAVAWGPWAEVGMVSHLEQHLVRRGLKLIPPATGAAMFADELHFGRKGETEVIIGGGAEEETRPKRSREQAPAVAAN